MKRIIAPVITVLAMTMLVSCAATPATHGVSIVASTDVYGSIATAIAGKHATVTSFIDNPSQDPHEFEASARAQLDLTRADVILMNGGGYDDFMEALLSGAHNGEAKVLRAVDFSGKSDTDIGANEHVWYDLNTVRALADALAESLATLDPANADNYRSNSERFDAELGGLQARVHDLAAAHSGETVLVTEPVPLYLLGDAGLTNLTPTAFSTAIENGQGVPPATMKDVLNLLAGGEVDLLAYNEQTEGPETAQVVAAAKTHGVPVIAVTETLPAGLDYLNWMSGNIRAIAGALA